MLKWRIFKEKLPESFRPMWVVWDEHNGEFLFKTGKEALTFAHFEITNRALAKQISGHQERIRREKR